MTSKLEPMNISIQHIDYQNEIHQKHLRELMDIYAQDPMGGGKPIAEEVLEALPQALLEIGSAFTLIAYCSNQPAGLLTGFKTLSSFKAKPLINIHDVMVHPQWRRQGIARKLLESAEKYALQQGCCKLTLEILSGNKQAQKLYRDYGFGDYVLDASAGTALFWQKIL